MNKKEYYESPICGKNYEYKYVHNLLAEWKCLNGISSRTKCVVHHRDDTDELAHYNNIEHYERWGFDDDGTFEYGKYVIFMTQSAHNTHHFKDKPNPKLAGKNNPMYGTHRSGEQAPMYGKKHSDKTKQKMSYNHTDVSGNKNPFYGKTHSEDAFSRMMNYHKATSEAYHKYREEGGILKWKDFRHAVKVGEISIDSFNNIS